jgi:hypothetical protein
MPARSSLEFLIGRRPSDAAPRRTPSTHCTNSLSYINQEGTQLIGSFFMVGSKRHSLEAHIVDIVDRSLPWQKWPGMGRDRLGV